MDINDITQSGTYDIMEDIEFDLNAADLDAPTEGAKQYLGAVRS